MKNNKKGFTLIELLVVIAIIGLLSTLAVVALNNARQKSRDARRVADIKQIQTAFELFYNDAGNYPTAPLATVCFAAAVAGELTGCALSETNDISATAAGTVYMGTIPGDPDNSAAYLMVGAGANTYTIEYTLEGTTGGIPAGTHRASPIGICDDPSC
ncbi:prepilin-type N-terminal cleavage/methylation domain-containing protein [Candidatus Parcubacteria bacterium]|nr:prepilin-type N-terminal cleavage/methylation domain-containing protein [Candidatus Parcubacteria bacterium]